LVPGHGLWFGTTEGIFPYIPDGKFQNVSTAVGEITGRCS